MQVGSFSPSACGGIRTHRAKRHIGFQDRAVITVSVRKQSGVYRIRTCTAFLQGGIATRSDTITATHRIHHI